MATGFLRNSMLNEEGGIDPEQFRMEAMFDRMDALGKSVLGLTIQCCQCHDHKYDPLTQQDYYRLFAFLNSDHEAQPTVYAPSSWQRAIGCARNALDRGRSAQATPDWAERMASWEAEVAGGQPEWEVLVPESYVEVGGGAKLRLLDDESMLCAGYAPTHCTFRVVGTSKLKHITAVRMELLNDPNLPRGGPGRSFKGTCALTEIKVEAKPAGADAKAEAEARSPRPRRRLRAGRNAAGTEVRRSLGQEARGGSGGDGLRRQERNRLGHRRGARTPQSAAQGGVSLRKADRVWERRRDRRFARARSRRLEQRRPSEQPAGPVPHFGHRRRTSRRPIRCRAHVRRDPGHSARAAHAGANGRSVFATGAPPCPSGRRPTNGSRPCGRSGPRARRRWCLQSRDEPRETHMLKRGDFLKPGDAVTPGVPEVLHDLPEDAPPTRLTLARWLVDPTQPDDGPRAREPDVAGLFWHGHRGHERRSGRAERSAQPPAIARLAGLRADGLGLEPEGHAPADRAVGHVSAIVARLARAVRAGSAEPAARARGRAFASKAKSCATSRWRPAGG